MSAPRRHWPAAAAATYCVLVIAGLLVAPAPPGVDATTTTVVTYYRDHSDSVRAVVWLIAVSLVPLAVVVSSLRQRLEGLGRDVLLLGAATFMAATTIELWVDGGLAARATTSTPDTVGLLAGIGAYFTPTLTVADVLMTVPVAVAALTTGAFPRWYGWLTLVFALEQTVETMTMIGRHGFIAAGGAMNYTLGAGLFLVWVAASGYACTTATTTPPPDPGPAGAGLVGERPGRFR